MFNIDAIKYYLTTRSSKDRKAAESVYEGYAFNKPLTKEVIDSAGRYVASKEDIKSLHLFGFITAVIVDVLGLLILAWVMPDSTSPDYASNLIVWGIFSWIATFLGFHFYAEVIETLSRSVLFQLDSESLSGDYEKIMTSHQLHELPENICDYVCAIRNQGRYPVRGEQLMISEMFRDYVREKNRKEKIQAINSSIDECIEKGAK